MSPDPGPASASPPVEPPAPGQPWTILHLIRWSAGYLEGKGVEKGRLDAEHLLADALGTERLELYLQYDRPLTPEELATFKERLLRRADREPLQYIVGRTAFRELDLRTDPRVLIPRPETEVLVEEVLAWVRETHGPAREAAPAREAVPTREAASAREEEPNDEAEPAREPAPTPEPTPTHEPHLSALDLGTGSGCIALSLLLEGPFGRVVATDPSADALEVARANAADADLGDRVDLRAGSLYDPLSEDETFHVVVSNPPYVASGERETLAPEVREWEPGAALFGGADGTEILGPLIAGASRHLRPGGLLALEVGLGQASGVADMIRETGAFADPRIRRDLAGRERIVLAVRRAGAGPDDVGPEDAAEPGNARHG